MGAEGAETGPTRPSGGTERVSAVLGPGNLGSHALLLDGGFHQGFTMENPIKMNDLEVPQFQETHYLYA